jgi:hypothetical protein
MHYFSVRPQLIEWSSYVCSTPREGSWERFQNTSFSLQLKNGPNTLERYITVVQRGLKEQKLKLIGSICKLQKVKCGP